jgi:hypothetical protein
VVSKTHTYYKLVSRKVVREFDMAESVAEVATSTQYKVGLELQRVTTIELPKMDFAARPGARGAYFEAILFLRKNR